tara:strand:- start:3075 stop:3656 length:582 start_codon:yes stop_codon:yes gene_type:complete
MKRILLTLVLALGLLTANAQIEKLAGPRIGMTLITAGPVADFLHEGFDFDENDRYGSTGPAFTTQYGWQWESRFADGGGEIVGIVEWIVLVAGMEQGKFLPSATSVIGARTANGLEFGVGPNLSLSGVGMVFGVGYNFKSGSLNLPVNLVFMPGRKLSGNIETWDNDGNYTYEEYDYNSGSRISIMIGFNMSK